jgi:hypothetical protein
MEMEADVFCCQESNKEVDCSSMLRQMSTAESTMSEVSHELHVARWHALEQMILEERACRTKEVAEIHKTLAIVSVQPSFQPASNGLVIEEPHLCLGSAHLEACEGTPSASQVDVQSFSKIIIDMRQNFASHLKKLESDFLTQVDRHMKLLKSTWESMDQQQEKVQEVEQLMGAEQNIEAIFSMAAKSKGLLGGQTSKSCKTLHLGRAENARPPRLQSPIFQGRRTFMEPTYTPVKMMSGPASPLLSSRATISGSASPPRATFQSYLHQPQTFSPSTMARGTFSPPREQVNSSSAANRSSRS